MRRVLCALLLVICTRGSDPLNEAVIKKFISVVCTRRPNEMPKRILQETQVYCVTCLAAWAELKPTEFVSQTKELVKQVHAQVINDDNRKYDLLQITEELENNGLTNDEILTTLSKRYYSALRQMEEVKEELGMW